MRALTVKPKYPICEAVQWQPTENGRQEHGWPRSKRWLLPSTWEVSAIDLTLFMGPLRTIVHPGDWIVLRTQEQRFMRVSRDDFNKQYEVLP